MAGSDMIRGGIRIRLLWQTLCQVSCRVGFLEPWPFFSKGHSLIFRLAVEQQPSSGCFVARWTSTGAANAGSREYDILHASDWFLSPTEEHEILGKKRKRARCWHRSARNSDNAGTWRTPEARSSTQRARFFPYLGGIRRGCRDFTNILSFFWHPTYLVDLRRKFLPENSVTLGESLL